MIFTKVVTVLLEGQVVSWLGCPHCQPPLLLLLCSGLSSWARLNSWVADCGSRAWVINGRRYFEALIEVALVMQPE